MQNVIKIYHVVQELRALSLIITGLIDWTNSHGDYSAYPRVVPLRHNIKNTTISHLVVQQSKLSPDLLWMSICTVVRGYPCVSVWWGGGGLFMWHNPFSLHIRALLVENKVSKV